MDENTFELQLIEVETYVEAPPTVSRNRSTATTVPVSDKARDDAAIATLKGEAEKHGLVFRNDREVKETESSRREHESAARRAIWPAPGSEDTELGVLMEPEVRHGEAEVYTRVQA